MPVLQPSTARGRERQRRLPSFMQPTQSWSLAHQSSMPLRHSSEGRPLAAGRRHSVSSGGSADGRLSQTGRGRSAGGGTEPGLRPTRLSFGAADGMQLEELSEEEGSTHLVGQHTHSWRQGRPQSAADGRDGDSWSRASSVGGRSRCVEPERVQPDVSWGLSTEGCWAPVLLHALATASVLCHPRHLISKYVRG